MSPSCYRRITSILEKQVVLLVSIHAIMISLSLSPMDVETTNPNHHLSLDVGLSVAVQSYA